MIFIALSPRTFVHGLAARLRLRPCLLLCRFPIRYSRYQFGPRLLPEHEIADNSFENALLGPVVAHFYRVTGLMKDLSSDGNV